MDRCSLYIHIPFCQKKCGYCDFLSFDHCIDKRHEYVDALINEIISYKELLKDRLIDTIFIGGGTPSILECSKIGSILNTIYKLYKLSKDCEITIECNPGTITLEKAKCYKSLGINRISMGLQSTDNKALENLGRIHNYNEFVTSFYRLREIGFNNINIDLMFGLPNQTVKDWEETLLRVVKFNPEHISAYGLIIEEGTAYYNKYKQGRRPLPSEDDERDMYWRCQRILTENDYHHYEISNYSKKGYACKHNIVYWTLKDYIGLGLGASSYFNNRRYDNTKSIDEYSKIKVKSKMGIINKQLLTTKEQKEEFMFLGLRMLDGIDAKEYYKKFNVKVYDDYEATLKVLSQQKLIHIKDDVIKLSHRGIDISNYVMAQFLID